MTYRTYIPRQMIPLLVAFILGGIIVAVSGKNPLLAFQDLLAGGFGLPLGRDLNGPYQLSETLVYTIPLILAGLSVAVAFRSGLFNIGAEGQLILGAIAATVVGIRFAAWPRWALLPAVLLSGAAAGSLWGGMVGLLKAGRGAHEVVTTIMLNYVAQFLLEYLIVGGPLEQQGLSSASAPIGPGGELPPLFPPGMILFGTPANMLRVHTGLLVALVAAACFALLMRRMVLGYEIRVVGESHRAARYAGISVSRTVVITMLFSGAFAGLAGAVAIAGLRHNLTDIYRPDTTGFDAIAVALLGQNNALGVVLAAVLFGGLHVGGQYMQSDAGISSSLVQVIQALVLFSIAGDYFSRRASRRRTPKDPASPNGGSLPEVEPTSKNHAPDEPG